MERKESENVPWRTRRESYYSSLVGFGKNTPRPAELVLSDSDWGKPGLWWAGGFPLLTPPHCRPALSPTGRDWVRRQSRYLSYTDWLSLGLCQPTRYKVELQWENIWYLCLILTPLSSGSITSTSVSLQELQFLPKNHTLLDELDPLNCTCRRSEKPLPPQNT